MLWANSKVQVDIKNELNLLLQKFCGKCNGGPYGNKVGNMKLNETFAMTLFL